MTTRKTKGSAVEHARGRFRKANPTGVLTVKTESEHAAEAGRYRLRATCADALCGHPHCDRDRKSRADAERRAVVVPGTCGKPTRKGTCRGPQGCCPVHDRRQPPAFAW